MLKAFREHVVHLGELTYVFGNLVNHVGLLFLVIICVLVNAGRLYLCLKSM